MKKDIKRMMYGYSDTDDIANDIEVKGKIIQVHNPNVKQQITSDIILAKWEEPKDKRFVIDLATIRSDCYSFALEMLSKIEAFHSKSITGLPSNWEEQKKIQLDNLDNMFMVRINWLSNLNRNNPNNHIIKELMQSQTIDREESLETGFSKEMKQLKKALSNKEVEER